MRKKKSLIEQHLNLIDDDTCLNLLPQWHTSIDADTSNSIAVFRWNPKHTADNILTCLQKKKKKTENSNNMKQTQQMQGSYIILGKKISWWNRIEKIPSIWRTGSGMGQKQDHWSHESRRYHWCTQPPISDHSSSTHNTQRPNPTSPTIYASRYN